MLPSAPLNITRFWNTLQKQLHIYGGRDIFCNISLIRPHMDGTSDKQERIQDCFPRDAVKQGLSFL